ncbi:MAG: hypothetical protein RIS86_1765, partial [Planctomycetota bacterium]
DLDADLDLDVDLDADFPLARFPRRAPVFFLLAMRRK